MNVFGMTLFLLAFINLILISLMLHLKKTNWAVSLSILEIILVYFAMSLGI